MVYPEPTFVMYRMNAQSRAIEESMLRYGIRYQLVGGTRFYSRREVKDALAYLRILRSDTDSVSFERIINVPARSIGERTIEVLRAAAAREDGTTWAAIEAAASGDLDGIMPRMPPLPIIAASSSGVSARGWGSSPCRSCSTKPSRHPAIGRCSRTAPKTVRSAGRTCWSFGR